MDKFVIRISKSAQLAPEESVNDQECSNDDYDEHEGNKETEISMTTSHFPQ